MSARPASVRMNGVTCDPLVARDPRIKRAIADGAWFAFSLSGGKDSTAAAFAAMRYLDVRGHPRGRRIAIHADLDRAEWETTPATVEAIAAMLGLPLVTVRRSAGDMVHRWEQRFEGGKARYTALSTYRLIGPWSSAALRFCTSEMKAQVLGPRLARDYPGLTIVSIIGIRREESTSRAATPIARVDERFARTGNAYGTRMLTCIRSPTGRHARSSPAMRTTTCRCTTPTGSTGRPGYRAGSASSPRSVT